MPLAQTRRSWQACCSALALACGAPALAATPNVTGADANQLNLLAPFLNLNATGTGQQTLATNLASAIAVNQFAAARNAVAATAVSDVNLLGNASNSVAGVGTLGVAANLGGGLPPQTAKNGIIPVQQYGGLGALGPAFQASVAATGGTAPAVTSLLVTAYAFASQDLGVAKNYFANGTANGTTAAAAPAGYTLPTANGYPSVTNSVYDTAYGVSNKTPGQNPEGDSRPYQVSPGSIALFDPADTSGSLNGNPAFPSGHTTYAYTDSLLIGMLSPQNFQAMVLRGSEYGNSRIALGAHYPLDVIASRAFVAYDLAQLLNGTDPAYQVTNAVGSTTALNLSAQFVAAASQLNPVLAGQAGGCGGSLAACAATNPYLSYSAATYASAPFVSNAGSTAASQNAAIFRSRLTYGLPTLAFAAAPREGAPAGGPDASILLATVYGGSTGQAQALAKSVGGPLYGNLSSATINQIIVNTEGNALAAFYGTPLSYWTRINLYDAAGYFGNVTGSITLASTDQLATNVTVAGANAALDRPAGVLSGTGTITGTLTIQSGGAFAAQGNGTAASTPLRVVGAANLQAGSRVVLTGGFLPGTPYTLISTTGGAAVDPTATVDLSQNNTLLALFTGALTGTNGQGVSVTLTSHIGAVATNANQVAVATALDRAGNAGGASAGATSFLSGLIGANTAATAPAALASLSGEGLADQQQAAIEADSLFLRTVMDRGAVPGGGGAVWGAAFGQERAIDGQYGPGSARTTNQTHGGVIGFDHPLGAGFSLGAAGGYSSSTATVSARATAGKIEAAHGAIYGIGRFGSAFYVGAAVSYAHFRFRTDRTVSALGSASLEKARFSGDEWLGRIEAGYRVAIRSGDLTPVAGFEAGRLKQDGFSEFGASGPAAGLDVAGRTARTEKSFVGLQFTGGDAGEIGQVVPFARATWEHEFKAARLIDAGFSALPGSGFTVAAAEAPRNAARINTGLRLQVARNVGLFASFDGALSARSDSYGGNGGLRISW